jgi:hypothetical protein
MALRSATPELSREVADFYEGPSNYRYTERELRSNRGRNVLA